jgi:pyruvate formate-lyase activating enzyme-like uncharacterized protein
MNELSSIETNVREYHTESATREGEVPSSSTGSSEIFRYILETNFASLCTLLIVIHIRSSVRRYTTEVQSSSIRYVVTRYLANGCYIDLCAAKERKEPFIDRSIDLLHG